jgi:biotin carboxyl carrier protein
LLSPAVAGGSRVSEQGTDVVSPMLGTVVTVDVTAGQHVTAGTPLVHLESMKMQHPVRASAAGTVAMLM